MGLLPARALSSFSEKGKLFKKSQWKVEELTVVAKDYIRKVKKKLLHLLAHSCQSKDIKLKLIHETKYECECLCVWLPVLS